MNQYKISVFWHYIGIPAMLLARAAARRVRRVANKITGRWWCAGCNKYHHGRVYAFSLDDFLSDGVCGLHLEKQYAKAYHFVRAGREMSPHEKKKLKSEIYAALGVTDDE